MPLAISRPVSLHTLERQAEGARHGLLARIVEAALTAKRLACSKGGMWAAVKRWPLSTARQ